VGSAKKSKIKNQKSKIKNQKSKIKNQSKIVLTVCVSLSYHTAVVAIHDYFARISKPTCPRRPRRS
jgi:hypothetical protein